MDRGGPSADPRLFDTTYLKGLLGVLWGDAGVHSSYKGYMRLFRTYSVLG